MNNNWINLNLTNKIKIDIYSYAEEKLFLNVLIKKDLEYRKLAWEYAEYLEKIKDYIDLDNFEEIISFLKDKSNIESDKTTDLEKYMKKKFDYIDSIYSNKEDNKIILWNLLEQYFPFYNVEKWYSHFYDITKISDYDLNYWDNFYIIPFLILSKEDNILKIKKFRLNNKYEELKKDLDNEGNWYKNYVDATLEKFIKTNNKINIKFKDIFLKTDMLCDYRYIDKSIF